MSVNDHLDIFLLKCLENNSLVIRDMIRFALKGVLEGRMLKAEEYSEIAVFIIFFCSFSSVSCILNYKLLKSNKKHYSSLFSP